MVEAPLRGGASPPDHRALLQSRPRLGPRRAAVAHLLAAVLEHVAHHEGLIALVGVLRVFVVLLILSGGLALLLVLLFQWRPRQAHPRGIRLRGRHGPPGRTLGRGPLRRRVVLRLAGGPVLSSNREVGQEAGLVRLCQQRRREVPAVLQGAPSTERLGPLVEQLAHEPQHPLVVGRQAPLGLPQLLRQDVGGGVRASRAAASAARCVPLGEARRVRRRGAASVEGVVRTVQLALQEGGAAGTETGFLVVVDGRTSGQEAQG
mmetsp:Transcript_31687/g.98657  ORF Transcript_31687/g.98657 Transcript_31687/m.98657 type:complete len:262 (+) Transcript_31687:2053-2838(+)